MTLEEINKKKIKTTTFFAALTSIILFIIRFINYKITSSNSINLTAIDSIIDCFSSIMNFFVAYLSSLPKTNKTPKGLDKIIPLATILQSILITIFACTILQSSIVDLIHLDCEVHNLESGMILIIASLMFNIMLVLYQNKVIQETDSIIIKIDKVHFFSDILTNIFLLFSMILMKYFKIFWLDSISGIILSLFLLYSIYHLFIASIYSILDINYEQESRDIISILKIENIILKEEDVTVFFNGTKYIIEITEKDSTKHLKIQNIINDTFYIKQNNCLTSGCTHISNALTQNALFDIKFKY